MNVITADAKIKCGARTPNLHGNKKISEDI
jgi:hypothetical protein